jgi:hypothetical protein
VPKQDKILIALFVSIYIFEVFFENVPIWQLFAGNFMLVLMPADRHRRIHCLQVV